MRTPFQTIALLAIVMSGLVDHAAHAALITWFAPTDVVNSNANFPGGTNYTNNFGVAFKTGANISYSLDWVKLNLNSSNVAGGNATVKLALRDTTNATAYSAVAGTTEYAVDTISFTVPPTTSTPFDLNLDASLIPNVASYVMSGNTAYSLILYSPTVNIGLGRRTGYANGTTNNFYTVSEGFTALDTFRNNIPNYSNSASSFPTLGISFGRTESVPEPSSLALAVGGIVGWRLMARRRGRAKAA